MKRRRGTPVPLKSVLAGGGIVTKGTDTEMIEMTGGGGSGLPTDQNVQSMEDIESLFQEGRQIYISPDGKITIVRPLRRFVMEGTFTYDAACGVMMHL